MKLLKKGQVGGLQGFILAIVTVAIVLAIGLIVLTELQGATKLLATTSVSNESVAFANVSGFYRGIASQAGDLFRSVSACRNRTGAEPALVLNVDCNVTSTGTVTVNPINNTAGVRLDYSHYTPTGAYNSSGTIITKLATVPTWIGIIIIVALAFIVLSFFIGRRQ